MTRQEMIEAIIDSLLDNWGSQKDFDIFVKDILRNGFNGFANMSDEQIADEYRNLCEYDEGDDE